MRKFGLSLLVASSIATFTMPMTSDALIRRSHCGAVTGAIVEKAKKATVQISVKTEIKELPAREFDPNAIRVQGFDGPLPPELIELFKKQHDKNQAQAQTAFTFQQLFGNKQYAQGTGSGVFIGQKNFVLTNAHVVNQGMVDEIEVRAAATGFTYPGKLVGWDSDLDLAVIKIDEQYLDVLNETVEVAEFLPSTESIIPVESKLFALGNPFGVEDFASTITLSSRFFVPQGSKSRFLLLNGSINPGNSGGATFDCSGRVAGINTAIISQGGGSNGIGMAIPSEVVLKVAPHLMKNPGEFKSLQLGIAIGVRPAGPRNTQQVFIAGFPDENGLGKAMGLQEGDVILKVNNEGIRNHPGLLVAALLQVPEGEKLTLDILRGQTELQLSSGMNSDSLKVMMP